MRPWDVSAIQLRDIGPAIWVGALQDAPIPDHEGISLRVDVIVRQGLEHDFRADTSRISQRDCQPWTFCDRRGTESCTARGVNPLRHLSHKNKRRELDATRTCASHEMHENGHRERRDAEEK